MKYRTLGKTGLRVSEIGVGAWQLGGPLILDGKSDGHPELGREVVIDLIRRAGSELGINFIDTAEQYAAGESERRVGEALEGQRDKWIIGSKFGAQVGGVSPVERVVGIPSGGRVNDVSAKRIPISLENSLRGLKTDHLDVYVYHSPPDEKEAEGVARVLESAKKKGQVRAVGISTNNLAHVELLHRLNSLDVVQFSESMIDPQNEMRGFLQKHNIGAVVRGALAAGQLSGKYFHKPPAFRPEDIRGNWMKPENYTRFAAFEPLVTAKRSMPQTALRWLLDKPGTHTVILGAKSFAEYRDAVGAVDLPALTAEELKLIDRARKQIVA